METERAPLYHGSETVLILDDDPMIRGFGAAAMEHLGYKVLLASDGVEGLDILERERDRIRLVVLDLLLPGMSGREVYDRIREMDRDIRVVVISGLDYNEAKESFGELAPERFIMKPFSVQSLSLAVKKALEEE